MTFKVNRAVLGHCDFTTGKLTCVARYRPGRRITLSGVSRVAVYSTLALPSPHKRSISLTTPDHWKLRENSSHFLLNLSWSLPAISPAAQVPFYPVNRVTLQLAGGMLHMGILLYQAGFSV